MNRHCSLCGRENKVTNFKDGFVCEKCLDYVRVLDLEATSSAPTTNDNPLDDDISPVNKTQKP